MKEIVFINRNAERWHKFEELIGNPGQVEPDMLSDMFIQLTDDLAFARTNFPGSKTSLYLNGLVARVHALIYRSRSVKKGQVKHFFQYEYPSVIYSNRRFIWYAILIFIISVGLGILSTTYDPDYARMIMGDSYINMTLANIEKGDPMAVYKQMHGVDMFLGVSANNIYIAFLAFLFGCFTSLGTGFILFRNGVMLGTFHAFLFQQGYLSDALLTIWIHGTLEIFAILVSGAAGLMIGNSILFPGSYSRYKAFTQAVRNGIRMVGGLVPVFLVAAFFEGFITRHTDFPLWAKLSFIIPSLAFILYYFAYYPRKISNPDRAILFPKHEKTNQINL
jgi:uncharacterized membrane protein SpoIIM required for sporulation